VDRERQQTQQDGRRVPSAQGQPMLHSLAANDKKLQCRIGSGNVNGELRT
jgi:hypothetical protein